MKRRLVVVCTANVCRSPVPERLLARHSDGRVDIDGERWAVSSSGTAAYPADLDRRTVVAAAEAGIDISAHLSRQLDRDLLATDDADLVVTMARAQPSGVVALDPAVLDAHVHAQGAVAPSRDTRCSHSRRVVCWLATPNGGRPSGQRHDATGPR